MSLLFFLTLLVTQTAAQTRLPVAQPPAQGQITGIVTSDREGKSPVRRAVVTVRGEQSGEHVITTDDDGRFAFDELPADRYTITATRPAYLVGSFGATKPGGQGSPLALATGEHKDISLWMAKGAVISGRVIAPDGLPAGGVTVSALAPAIADGQRVLLAANGASATVDDEGQFRIYGLRPASYVIVVKPTTAMARGLIVGLTDSTSMVNYSPVYFPGTTDVAEARRIELQPGEEASGVDLPLRLVPAASISGVVRFEDELGLPTGTRLLMTRATQGLAPYDAGEVIAVDTAGRFRVPPVAPGRYLLRLVNLTVTPSTAQLAARPRVYWGRTEVIVDGKDVTDVAVQLRRGLSLSGTVAFDSSAEVPALNPTAISLSLQGITIDGIRPVNPATVSPDASGTFTISGVGPGRYRVSSSLPPMSGRSFGWFLQSVSLDGIALESDILDVPETGAVGPLTVRFTTTPSRINGRLVSEHDTPASGVAIVAFPVSERGWVLDSRNIQNVHPATDGTFTITNLPAGEYFLCTLEELNPFDLGDVDFLRALIPSSVRVTVKENETSALTLKIQR